MAGWNLNLTLVSASNLLDVRSLGYLRVYAKVSINEVEKLTYTSPVDCDGQTYPVWNFEAPYNITDKIIEICTVVVKLYCERTFQKDKYVGEVNIPMKTLFESRNVNGGFGDFEVERVNENGGFGALKLSYRFVKIVQEVQTSPVSGHGLQETAETLETAKEVVEFFVEGKAY